MSLIQKIREKKVDVVKDVLKNDSDSSCVIYINPYNYLFFRKRLELLDNVTGIRFDGMLMKFWAETFITGGESVKRQSFDMTSLAPKVFKYCIRKNKSIFLAGGTEADINKFVKKINEFYPDLDITGYCHGYLNENEIIHKVLEAKADFVILGLGNKKQERVASKLYKIRPAIYFTCGAFITQTANTLGVNYYPSWIDKYNLRWLYRFFKEKHVLWRVIRFYPEFIITSLWDFANLKVGKKYFEN